MTLHSSIKVNKKVSEYLSIHAKYYYLPLFEKTFFSEFQEFALGANNPKDRTLEEVRSSCIKAVEGRYGHIKVPFDRSDSVFISKVLTIIEEFELKIIFQVCTSLLEVDSLVEELKEYAENIAIEWVFDGTTAKSEKSFSSLMKVGVISHLSICLHHTWDWKVFEKSSFFSSFTEIHLYFPYSLDQQDSFLICKEAKQVLDLIRKKYLEKVFLPPRGVDLWDHRVKDDFDMEPYVLPCFETCSLNPQIQFSVIIPTFNNQNHLRVVLRHLAKLKNSKDNFEIIVVDDGGTDQTQELVCELLDELNVNLNFKYIFFKRSRIRVMGDNQYRAGISRNLGAKNAVGDIFCFLDSDIIVPPDYLTRVESALEKYDALQAKRVNLSHDASTLDFSYEAVDKKRDLIPDEEYWEEFLNTDDWSTLAYNWKYVCTHSFSIKRDLFWEVGGIKRNFIFYGFEDTDLGFRLVKAGHRLHLLDVTVYHMFHENTRSEFMNLKSFRHNLLSRTAQIFYLHHLDDDIFETLRGYMEPELTFEYLKKKLANFFTLRFLWQKRPLVFKSLF